MIFVARDNCDKIYEGSILVTVVLLSEVALVELGSHDVKSITPNLTLQRDDEEHYLMRHFLRREGVQSKDAF